MTEFSKTISKAFKILDCYMNNNELMSLTELQEKTGIEKSTLCRFLKTMEISDYVEQDSKSKKYKLGKRILILGLSIINELDIRKEAIPYMKKLNDTFEETVNLGIIYNNNLLYLDIIKGKGHVHEAATVGGQDPLYSTSMGKVLLSSLDDNELDSFLDNIKIIPKTSNTITDKNEIKKIIADIKRNGFARDNEENEKGLAAYGIPIRNFENKIIAAISISYLNISVDDDKKEKILKALLKVSKELSERFGYIKNNLKF